MEQTMILLADDDRDDTELFCEALANIDDSLLCISAGNGKELLSILEGLGAAPYIIFLDLNMPVMDGMQCLKQLKNDARYRHIPVIMISTSSHQQEMDTAINLGAICYFVKPNSFNELTHLLRVIVNHIGTGLADAIQYLKESGSRYIYTCQPECQQQ